MERVARHLAKRLHQLPLPRPLTLLTNRAVLLRLPVRLHNPGNIVACNLQHVRVVSNIHLPASVFGTEEGQENDVGVYAA